MPQNRGGGGVGRGLDSNFPRKIFENNKGTDQRNGSVHPTALGGAAGPSC